MERFNGGILATSRDLFNNDAVSFDGIRAVGVDERILSQADDGPKPTKVIIDLPRHSPAECRSGCQRILPRRLKQGSGSGWQAVMLQSRDEIACVVEDGSTGYRAAIVEEQPAATAAMDHPSRGPG